MSEVEKDANKLLDLLWKARNILDETNVLSICQTLIENNIGYKDLMEMTDANLLQKLAKLDNLCPQMQIMKLLYLTRPEKAYKINRKYITMGYINDNNYYYYGLFNTLYYYSIQKNKHYLITPCWNQQCNKYDLENHTKQYIPYPNNINYFAAVKSMKIINPNNGNLYFVSSDVFVVLNLETHKWKIVPTYNFTKIFQFNDDMDKMRLFFANNLLYINLKGVYNENTELFSTLNANNLPLYTASSEIMYIPFTNQLMMFGSYSNNDDIWIHDIQKDDQFQWKLAAFKLPFFKGDTGCKINYSFVFEQVVMFVVGDDCGYILWFLDIIDGSYCCSKLQLDNNISTINSLIFVCYENYLNITCTVWNIDSA
eukprot:456697_1